MPDVVFWMRVSSAALFVLLGVGVLAVSRLRRVPILLGAFLVLTGATVIMTNVRQWMARDGDPVSIPQYVIELVALAGFSAIGPFLAREVPSPRATWRPLGVGIAVGLLACVGFVGRDINEGLSAIGSPDNYESVRAWAIAVYVVGIVGMLVAASIRLGSSPPSTGAQWARSLSLLALFGPYIILFWPVRFGSPASWWSLASMVILVAGLTIPALLAAARTRDRRFLFLGLAWPALAVLSYLYLLAPNETFGVWDPWGMYGVARLLGWLFLVYAILRADLLGVPLPRVVVSRGTLAAASLAVLFIVAQVMQNFLSAEYGLLTGGVIAGAFLFAASPMQRAFERMGEKRPSGGSGGRAHPSRSTVGKEQEGAYRDAVRLAMRDRRFEAEEELMLANLADRLGLTAMRAIEIRLAVEQERGLR